MIEVKSHLGNVTRSLLTPAETAVAERNPRNYIVCIVSNMADPDPVNWRLYCESYEKLPKKYFTYAVVGYGEKSPFREPTL